MTATRKPATASRGYPAPAFRAGRNAAKRAARAAQRRYRSAVANADMNQGGGSTAKRHCPEHRALMAVRRARQRGEAA